MTNPKAALAWIAIIALGLQKNAPLWVGLSIVIGTSVLSVIIHWVYAVAFSTPVMVRLYSKGQLVIAECSTTDRSDSVLNGVHHLLALMRAGRDRAYCLLRHGLPEHVLNSQDPGLFKLEHLTDGRPPPS